MPFNRNIEVRSSEKHGQGIFATRLIVKGTPVWRYRETDDCPLSLTGEIKNLVHTRAQMEHMAVDAPARTKAILWGGYLHDPSDCFIELRDGSQFTNHANTPNVGGGWFDSACDEVSIACRDIPAGEEIVDDYSVFQDMQSSWLSRLMTDLAPERAAFERSVLQTRPKGFYVSID